MPTKPFEPLLYRELARASAREIIDIASPLLQELVNYATNAFQRCQTASAGESAEDLPLLASYLHVIEMTDGIEVLISQSCPVPAIPLLRSSFEALVTIDYILEAEYQQRSFSWLVQYVHTRLKEYEMLDTSRKSGQDFLATLSTDKIGDYMKLPPMSDLPQAIENLESLLSQPNYQTVESEYQRLKKTNRRKLEWYSLFGGPHNLRELSRHVGRGAQYDFLYRYWSKITHAGDLSRFLTRTNEGSPAFKPIRNPADIKDFSILTASFILDATRKVLGKFRPGEERNLRKWYIQEIKGDFLH